MGTDHARGQLDQGHTLQRVAVHGAPGVWSLHNRRRHRVGEEVVQVPRAGWVLGKPLLLQGALGSLNEGPGPRGGPPEPPSAPPQALASLLASL